MLSLVAKVRFGPAGKPIDFKGKAVEPCEYLAERGLKAYEFQSTYGVKIKEDAGRFLAQDSKKNDVLISMHAPYYINLSAKKPDVRERTVQRLVQSAIAAEWIGAYRIVFHPGFYTSFSSEEAMKIAKDTISSVFDELSVTECKNFIFSPETTGKKSQLGNLNEIIELCQSFDHFEPTIDFAHVYARGQGCLKTKDDFNNVFRKIEDNLAINHLHSHFTKIEYSNSGEKKHHTLDEDEFGPDLNIFLESLIETGLNATVICETPLIDKDALKMKKVYDELLK